MQTLKLEKKILKKNSKQRKIKFKKIQRISKSNKSKIFQTKI